MEELDQNKKAMIEEQLRSLTITVGKIATALLGDEFNPKGGLVNKVEDLNTRVCDIEDTGNVHQVYVSILKYIAGVITTGVILGVIAIILKK